MAKRREEEKVPVTAPLKVIESRTLSKGFGWWSAVVLVESWGRKQLCFYLWQRKGDKWARKQKFTIQNQEQWEYLSECVEEMIPKLSAE